MDALSIGVPAMTVSTSSARTKPKSFDPNNTNRIIGPFRLGFAVALLLFAVGLAGCVALEPDESSDKSSDTPTDETVLGLPSEGTRSSPVTLSLNVAHDGQAGFEDGGSHYVFTTADMGTYDLTVSSLSSDRLHVDLYFTPTSEDAKEAKCNGNCAIAMVGAHKETAYYLHTVGMESGDVVEDATYTLTITRGKGDGSEDEPAPITLGQAFSATLPREGEDVIQLDAIGSSSYYGFTTTSAGSYLFNTTGLSVTTTFAMENIAANEGLNPLNCTGTEKSDCWFSLPGATAVLLWVRSSSELTEEKSFQLTASRGKADGNQDDPLALTLGTTAATGSDGISNSAGYYKFTTDDRINYFVVGTNTGNVTLTLYPDTTFNSSFPSSATVATRYLQQQPVKYLFTGLTAATTYYLKLTGGNSESFDLTASESVVDGILSDPQVLTVGQNHSGGTYAMVGSSGSSFYKFTTGSSQTTVNLSISNIDVALTARLYANSNFSESAVGNTINNPADTAFNLVLATGLTPSTAYYLKVYTTQLGTGSTFVGEKSYTISVN